MRVLVQCCLLAWMSTALWRGVADGQVAEAAPLRPKLTFEVATIKPFDKKIPMQATVGQSGRVLINGFNLQSLIAFAYDVPAWEITGAPGWSEQERYTVEAKVPEDLPVSSLNTAMTTSGIADARVREMLQGMLGERFRLQVHRESHAGTVYLLERTGKSTPLIELKRPPQSGDGHVVPTGWVQYDVQGWFLLNETMPQFARYASSALVRKPVIDRTGMTGVYQYRTPPSELDPDEQAHPLPLAEAFQNLLKTLGLKLVPEAGRVEDLMIDRAERPTAN